MALVQNNTTLERLRLSVWLEDNKEALQKIVNNAMTSKMGINFYFRVKNEDDIVHKEVSSMLDPLGSRVTYFLSQYS